MKGPVVKNLHGMMLLGLPDIEAVVVDDDKHLVKLNGKWLELSERLGVFGFEATVCVSEENMISAALNEKDVYKDRMCLPDSLIESMHVGLGHSKFKVFMSQLTRLGLNADSKAVQDLLSKCDICAKTTPITRSITSIKTTHMRSNIFNGKLNIDLVDVSTKLSVKVMNIIDDFSGLMIPKVVASKGSVEVLGAFQAAWASKFGWPASARTDRGSEFSQLWTTMMDNGVDVQKTAAYAPWSDGRVERANRSLLECLRRTILSSPALTLTRQVLCVLVQSVVPAILNNQPKEYLNDKTPCELASYPMPLDLKFMPGTRVLWKGQMNQDKCDAPFTEGVVVARVHYGSVCIQGHSTRLYFVHPSRVKLDPRFVSTMTSTPLTKTDVIFSSDPPMITNPTPPVISTYEQPKHDVGPVPPEIMITQPEQMDEQPKVSDEQQCVCANHVSMLKATGRQQAKPGFCKHHMCRFCCQVYQSQSTDLQTCRQHVFDSKAASQYKTKLASVMKGHVAMMAITDDDDEILKAQMVELSGFTEDQVWSEIPHGKAVELLRQGKARLLSTRWCISNQVKPDTDQTFVKARLVCRGYEDDRQTDTNSPTPQMTTIRCALATCNPDDEVWLCDIEKAYLKAEQDPNVTVLVKAPKLNNGKYHNGTSESHKDQFLILQKAMYGQKQAGLLWHLKLDSKIKALGYLPCPNDPCLYVRVDDEGNLRRLIVNVDDIMAIGKNVMNDVHDLKFKMKRERQILNDQSAKFLGITLKRTNDGFYMSTTEALSKLEEPNIKCKADTPLPSYIGADDDTPKLDQTMTRLYRSELGSLNWQSQTTRPDLEFATHFLGKFQAEPTEKAYKTLQRTKAYAMQNQMCIFVPRAKKGMRLVGYCDASWAPKHSGMKSVTGIVIGLETENDEFFPLCWKSHVQARVCNSSMAAECASAVEACAILNHLQLTLHHLHFSSAKVSPQVRSGKTPLCLKTDSKCVQMAVNVRKKSIPKDRSLVISIVTLREYNNLDKIVFEYVPSNLNLADDLTKNKTPTSHLVQSDTVFDS